MTKLYIGLMSGTSVDGIDAALVDFSGDKPQLVASQFTPYSADMRQQILDLCQPGNNEIHRLGELDITLANAFADATNQLLKSSSTNRSDVTAIGSHGHTIRHAPNSEQRFTMQIGDPNTIAAKTGITTVADFRRKDMALGGQGAPLVPAFHRSLFSDQHTDRVILNIGGIANITLLPKDTDRIIGFDTGPGNTLMDQWILNQQQKNIDKDGAWAAEGIVDNDLLKLMLADDYFKLAPPKSTGREYFNLTWIQQQLARLDKQIKPAHIQATLAELTAQTIIDGIKTSLTSGEILICGGGTHNKLLMARLNEIAAPDFTVKTTESSGVHPDWVEAIAFAWLAYQTMEKRAGNLPSVTGATQAAILGGVYYA